MKISSKSVNLVAFVVSNAKSRQLKASRKLYAIMFTDIEGYTSLMQKSESAAVNIRNLHREIFEVITNNHDGKIIQYYGDGTLSVFESAVIGVKCGIEMQRKFLKESSIPVRIGIHVGDIVITHDDIIGDAVNIASRIESLAIAGSVLVSDKVVEEIKNHNEIKVKTLGRFHLKNELKSRKVYAIDHDDLFIPKRSQLNGKTQERPKTLKTVAIYLGVVWALIQSFGFLIADKNWDTGLLDISIIIAFFGLLTTLIIKIIRPRVGLSAILLHSLNSILALIVFVSYILNPIAIEPSKYRILNLFEHHQPRNDESLKSIAVIPFSNYVKDKAQDYLYKGIHLGLIAELGQLSGIRIISPTSTLSYLNTKKSTKQIARELTTDVILESSIIRFDSIIQFNFNLVNVFPQNESLWSQEYRTTIDDIPNVYKEVSKNVALKINGTLQPFEEIILTKAHLPKPGSYESYLKGQYYAGFLTHEGLETAKLYFQKAIEIDPEFALGYGGLGLVWMSKKQMGYVSTAEANTMIKAYHHHSMQLDSLNSESWAGKGAISTWADFNWEEGEKAFLKSIELNPNKALTRAAYAHLLLILNRNDEAQEQMEYAERLDMLSPWVLAFSGGMNFFEGKIFTATKRFEKLKKLEPNHPMLNQYLLNKYVNTFQYDLAIEQFKKLIVLKDDREIYELIDKTYKQSDFRNTITIAADALEEISKTSYISPSRMFQVYSIIGDKEKRIYWLQKMHETKDPGLPYSAFRNNDPIQNDPRYIKIMEDIGLW